MIYRLGKGVHLVREGDSSLLVRKYPLRTVRCNQSLWKLLCSAEADGQVESSASVMESLAEAGLIERVWEKLSDSACPAVSIIIPVKDRQNELTSCLNSLKHLDYPKEKLEIIVVDDGSLDKSADVARFAGAYCIASGGVGLGPAASRNRGAKEAGGDLLAFIDSDCTASAGWLRELVSPFTMPETAAVGGIVRGFHTQSWIDRYEDAMSSLCLGRNEQWGGTGTDSFYLPSCNLLVRRKYFLAVNGFDERMMVGEDVDLCYRLRDKGFRIGYIPIGEIFHAHRSRIASFMSRRFAYGTSEALLKKKHARRHKKIQMSFLSFLILLLLPVIFVAPVLSVLIISSLLLLDIGRHFNSVKRLSSRPSMVQIIFARFRSTFSLGYYMSFHLVRYYLPLLAAISIYNANFAILTILIFLWSTAVDYVTKRSALSFAPFAVIYFLEQIAYSCGVFWGCLRQSSFSSYRVSFMFHPA